jgi:hypothetical protein
MTPPRRWPVPTVGLEETPAWVVGLVAFRLHWSYQRCYGVGLGHRALVLRIPELLRRTWRWRLRELVEGEPSVAYQERLYRLANRLVDEGRFGSPFRAGDQLDALAWASNRVVFQGAQFTRGMDEAGRALREFTRAAGIWSVDDLLR